MKSFNTLKMLIRDYVTYRKLGAESERDNNANRIKLEKEDNTLYIAFYPTGGLGDYIISSKLADELMTYGPCKIDVYCENIVFGNAIYSKRKGMRVIPYSMYDESMYNYDIAMKVEHFVHIQSYNAKRIMDLAPELFPKIETIRRDWGDLYLNIDEQCYRERIHFEQMKLLGLNRYTELRMGNTFKIEDCWTDVCLTDDGKARYQELLGGKKYITFNYGADAMHSKKKMQIKVWPAEYYEQLWAMLKKEHPEICIVQLGGKKAHKIKNADMYVCGENLETTKWVLKNSICHVDCEGGLVHLATQLKTHCIVIFGPTPLHMYGYPQNTNLINPECNNCMGIHRDWAFECFKEEEKPRCMYGITPQMVFDSIVNVLKR